MTTLERIQPRNNVNKMGCRNFRNVPENDYFFCIHTKR